MTAPDAKAKTNGSASIVRDADWALNRQEPESQERGPYSLASDEAILEEGRDRILDIAEKYIRHIGHRKTTVADIASDLGTSRANVYRFFPTRAAINNSVCARIVEKVTEIAFSIARTDAAASKKLVELLNILHRHSRMTLMEAKPIHELFVAAMNENWATMNAHNQRIRAILEAIIRQGLQTGEFQVEDADHATRGVITAFLPFFHPVLLEQRVQEGEDIAEAAHVQIRFIMRALGKSDWRSAEASEVMISA
ncbi:TetR/AcrR family transcriptional regulator [Rhizobium jaguaris]|uniref:TetR/AcrR family transcriptional regulator n=1 Tax=Rhizobium jaguaris TaxID=1312183 RepID=UPI001FE06FA4|nr:TetR/AcrR family transcriptional regulator [Rhizobium jaguaris]